MEGTPNVENIVDCRRGGEGELGGNTYNIPQ